jgi:hypothetical protein
VQDRLMPLEAIEMLRDPLQSLSFVQVCLLGLWILGVAARRGLDALIDFLFFRLVRSVLAGEQKRQSSEDRWGRGVYGSKCIRDQGKDAVVRFSTTGEQ